MIKQHPSFRGEEGEDGVCLGGHLLGLRQGAMFLQKWWLCEMDNQFDSGSDECLCLCLCKQANGSCDELKSYAKMECFKS